MQVLRDPAIAVRTILTNLALTHMERRGFLAERNVYVFVEG